MNPCRRWMVLMVVSVLALSACGKMSANMNFPAATSGSPTAGTLNPNASGMLPPAVGALSGSDLNALVTAAQAEGKVVVYSFTSRIAQVETAFEAAYPGIDFVGLDISSTQQIVRIKAEQDAGLAEVDVSYLSDAPVVYGELVQSGILERFVPAQFADRVPDMFEQPLLANRISTKVLMYNEQAYPNGSPIQNLWQLTLPEWRSKVVMVDPLIRDDYLDLMTELVIRSGEMATAYEQQFGQPITLGDGVQTAGEQWIRALFANDVVLVNDTDSVNAAVGALGQAAPPVGFTSYSDRWDNVEKGWALQIANDVAPTPGIAFPALLGIVKNAPHPAAAQLVIHFMMGDDTPTGGAGYAPFYVPGDYATRIDIAPHPDAVPPSQLRAWFIDPQRTYQIRQQVADLILTFQ